MQTHRSLLTNRLAELCFNLLLSCAIFLAAIPVHPQNKDAQKTSDQDDVIKVTSNLVNFDVMVKDKKGKAITDLKAEDFSLFENGVRQNIEYFDATLSGGNDRIKPAAIPLTTDSDGPVKLPRNIISLVLDGQTTEGQHLKHVRDGMTKYIKEGISDSDSVAIFAISGGLQLLQSFTDDKAKLIAAIEKADGIASGSKTSEQRSINDSMATLRDQLAAGPTGVVQSNEGGSALAQALISQHILEQYVQLRSTLSAQQTRPVLAGLAAICEGLRSIPGKKTLVMFSQGFVAPQSLDWQVQSTIDIANRANVTIYVIDSSGLVGGTPQSGALVPGSALSGISAATSQESRIRAGAGESVFDITRQEGLDRQQDLLYRISGDTGGQFIKNTNDIAAGLERIDEEIRSRYTLAYRSTDANFEGSFRKVKVEVRRPEAKVVARSGYYAIPPDQVVPVSPQDKMLLANFDTMSAHPTLPLTWQIVPFRSQAGYYTVPLSFEIPPAAVRFEQKGEKQRMQLEVVGVIRGPDNDKSLSRLGGTFAVELTRQQYESILNDKIFYRQDMQLEAGNYTVDLVVKDALSGKGVAKRQQLTLPVTDTEFSATEVVLSRHAEPLRQPPVGPPDVLSVGNVQIRPSTAREFQAADNLIIFFEVYNASAVAETGKPNVRVSVTLMKDGKPALKPLEYLLTDVVAEPVPHLTLAKYVKLAGLATGKYLVVIEAKDLARNKTLKQQTPFSITP
ncbi:MAG TPA: VWA domain-containing protein [Pyrinomonadaceae bacterium]|jgi:VWFA-related protein|nr:VWA domain-containing protein [Pyrinomonadaceae bacterium]